MNRRGFLKNAMGALGGLLLGKRATAEGTGTIVDGDDVVAEPLDSWLVCEEPGSTKWPLPDCEGSFIGDFLESFDCGVTWEYRDECEFSDTDWIVGRVKQVASEDADKTLLVDILPLQEEDCEVYHLNVPSADSTIYYVSDDGDDANDGLTPETALQTYDQALSRCGSGIEDLIITLKPKDHWTFYSARWRPDAPPIFHRDMEEVSIVEFLRPLGHDWPAKINGYMTTPEGTITYWYMPGKGISI